MKRLILLPVLLSSLLPLMASDVPEWAVAVFPSGAEFTLEIAATDRQRQLGYMFREKIPSDEGMIFLFDANERHSIWMKNCRVSLDIIWLDADFRVVEIALGAQPCPADGVCPSMQPMRASRYVLEVAGGRASEEKLKAGDLVIIHSEPSL